MSSETPKRRWYQFSLRLRLMVVVLFAMIGFRVYWAWENRNRLANVEEAVDEILELGGWAYAVGGRSLSQTWLEKQLNDPGRFGLKIVVVGFRWNASDTDAGLEHLKDMEKRESWNLSVGTLDLSGTNVTDAGLQHLKGLKNLRELFLDETDVTDEGVKELQRALPTCRIRR
ncbi:MAG: hypothetical protein IID44_28110 [Planctomycetes bacterium]|nr:hypothetical protein [Planctomycetota bacterium]